MHEKTDGHGDYRIINRSPEKLVEGGFTISPKIVLICRYLELCEKKGWDFDLDKAVQWANRRLWQLPFWIVYEKVKWKFRIWNLKRLMKKWQRNVSSSSEDPGTGCGQK